MTFNNLPYFIVVHSTSQAGSGDTATLYLSLPGEWSDKEKDAMRFPSRVLAASHAHRFKGEVQERAP